MALDENAVVVRFSCGQWSGQYRDKKLAEEIREEKNAKKAPRVIKPLAIDNELDELAKKVTECRTWHYKHSYPFKFGNQKDPIMEKGKPKKLAGVAIVPIDMFEDYCKEMQKFRLEIEAKARYVIEHYQELIDKAEAAQNGLFDRSNYPTVDELEDRYHFDLAFEPVPPDHFLTKVVSEELKKAEQLHQAKLHQAEIAANAEAFQRLHGVISHAFESLANPNKKFHDTLISNIMEMVQILPKMNIGKDPMLDALVKQAEQNLCGFLPDELRENPALRKEAADRARAILSTMAGHIGTPQPVEPTVIVPMPESIVPQERVQPFQKKKSKAEYALDCILQ